MGEVFLQYVTVDRIIGYTCGSCYLSTWIFMVRVIVVEYLTSSVCKDPKSVVV